MIIGIIGGLGGGKTVLAIKKVKDMLKEGKKRIISNVNLRFPHIYMSSYDLAKYITTNMENMDYDDSIFSDSILLWDEAHYTFEARQSTSSLNLEVSRFVTQVGKIDCDFIYTSQLATSQIDLRLRELTDEWYYVYRVNSHGKKVKGKRILNEKVYICGYKIDVLFPGMFDTPRKFRWDPTNFFNDYNTREFMYMDRNKLLEDRKNEVTTVRINATNRWLTQFDWRNLPRMLPKPDRNSLLAIKGAPNGAEPWGRSGGRGEGSHESRKARSAGGEGEPHPREAADLSSERAIVTIAP